MAAFGVYRTGRARVTLSVDLKDTRRDHRAAAVRFVFTERHHHRAVRLATLRGEAIRHAWRTITSANTGHLDVQECLGVWHHKRFVVRRCADGTAVTEVTCRSWRPRTSRTAWSPPRA